MPFNSYRNGSQIESAAAATVAAAGPDSDVSESKISLTLSQSGSGCDPPVSVGATSTSTSTAASSSNIETARHHLVQNQILIHPQSSHDQQSPLNFDESQEHNSQIIHGNYEYQNEHPTVAAATAGITLSEAQVECHSHTGYGHNSKPTPKFNIKNPSRSSYIRTRSSSRSRRRTSMTSKHTGTHTDLLSKTHRLSGKRMSEPGPCFQDFICYDSFNAPCHASKSASDSVKVPPRRLNNCNNQKNNCSTSISSMKQRQRLSLHQQHTSVSARRKMKLAFLRRASSDESQTSYVSSSSSSSSTAPPAALPSMPSDNTTDLHFSGNLSTPFQPHRPDAIGVAHAPPGSSPTMSRHFTRTIRPSSPTQVRRGRGHVHMARMHRTSSGSAVQCSDSGSGLAVLVSARSVPSSRGSAASSHAPLQLTGSGLGLRSRRLSSSVRARARRRRSSTFATRFEETVSAGTNAVTVGTGFSINGSRNRAGSHTLPRFANKALRSLIEQSTSNTVTDFRRSPQMDKVLSLPPPQLRSCISEVVHHISCNAATAHVSHSAQSQVNTDEQIGLVLQGIRHLTDASVARIFLLENSELMCYSSDLSPASDVPSTQSSPTQSVNDSFSRTSVAMIGIAGYCVRECQVVHIDCTESLSAFLSEHVTQSSSLDRTINGNTNISTMLSVPIMDAHSNVVSVLQSINKSVHATPTKGFTTSDCQLLESLGAQNSPLLLSRRQFDKEKIRRRRTVDLLQSVNQISSIDRLLDTTLQILSRTLREISATCITLYQSKSAEFANATLQQPQQQQQSLFYSPLDNAASTSKSGNFNSDSSLLVRRACVVNAEWIQLAKPALSTTESQNTVVRGGVVGAVCKDACAISCAQHNMHPEFTSSVDGWCVAPVHQTRTDLIHTFPHDTAVETGLNTIAKYDERTPELTSSTTCFVPHSVLAVPVIDASKQCIGTLVALNKWRNVVGMATDSLRPAEFTDADRDALNEVAREIGALLWKLQSMRHLEMV
jgi:GAF domain